MKTFKVIYLPHGREDKEWMNVNSTSLQSVQDNFQAGMIISIEEVNSEDDD